MNQTEILLTGEFRTVADVIEENITGFSTKGYQYRGATWEGSPQLLRYLVFKFLNKQTGLEIHILFFPAREERNGGFLVTIIKPVDHVLNVEDYLKLHGRKELSRYFTYRDPNTEVRAFAQAFLEVLVGLMRKELAPVLEGKVWEDTPIDWQGYK